MVFVSSSVCVECHTTRNLYVKPTVIPGTTQHCCVSNMRVNVTECYGMRGCTSEWQCIDVSMYVCIGEIWSVYDIGYEQGMRETLFPTWTTTKNWFYKGLTKKELDLERFKKVLQRFL